MKICKISLKTEISEIITLYESLQVFKCMTMHHQPPRIVRISLDGNVESRNGVKLNDVSTRIFTEFPWDVSPEAGKLLMKFQPNFQGTSSEGFIIRNSNISSSNNINQRGAEFNVQISSLSSQLNLSSADSSSSSVDQSNEAPKEIPSSQIPEFNILSVSQFSTQQFLEKPNLSEDDNSSEDEISDLELDQFVQQKMNEELMKPQKKDDQKSKLPVVGRFLPPVKKRKVNIGKCHLEEVATGSESINENELFSLTTNNQSEVLQMLHKCKELAFLIVFREGFTQFRDMSTIGAGFGSPRYVAVRVILENGEVCRHSLYMIEFIVALLNLLFRQSL